MYMPQQNHLYCFVQLNQYAECTELVTTYTQDATVLILLIVRIKFSKLSDTVHCCWLSKPQLSEPSFIRTHESL